MNLEDLIILIACVGAFLGFAIVLAFLLGLVGLMFWFLLIVLGAFL